jgi:predicted dehydrogenase
MHGESAVEKPGLQRQDIGLAIIGAGRIGTMRATLATSHAAVRMIGVADLNETAATTLAEKSGASLVGTDSREIISHPAINAVVVSTGEHQHVEPVLQALEMGKHVLVEKPIALKLEDADKLIAAAAQSSGSLHVGYSRRFKRRYLTVKEQISLGRLGSVSGLSARIYNSRAQVFQMLKRDPHATPVVDSLTYFVDMLGWWVPDNPAVEVWARGKGGTIRKAGFDCDDVTYAVVTLADGALVNFSCSFALPDKYPSLGYCARIEVIGTEGVLMIDDDHLDQIMYTERGIPHIYVPDLTVNMAFLSSSAPGDWVGGEFWGPLASETRNWLDFVATGRPCALATAREARSNLAITLAIEEAVASGKTVRLSETAVAR